MSLLRNGTLEKSVTQQPHADPGDADASLTPHLQNSSSLSSVIPGSPGGGTGGVAPPPYLLGGSLAGGGSPAGGGDAPLELRASLDC